MNSSDRNTWLTKLDLLLITTSPARLSLDNGTLSNDNHNEVSFIKPHIQRDSYSKALSIRYNLGKIDVVDDSFITHVNVQSIIVLNCQFSIPRWNKVPSERHTCPTGNPSSSHHLALEFDETGEGPSSRTSIRSELANGILHCLELAKDRKTYVDIGRRLADLLPRELVKPLVLIALGRVDVGDDERHDEIVFSRLSIK